MTCQISGNLVVVVAAAVVVVVVVVVVAVVVVLVFLIVMLMMMIMMMIINYELSSLLVLRGLVFCSEQSSSVQEFPKMSQGERTKHY